MLTSSTTSLKLVDDTTYSIITKPIVISEKSYILADVEVKEEIVYYPEENIYYRSVVSNDKIVLWNENGEMIAVAYVSLSENNDIVTNKFKVSPFLIETRGLGDNYDYWSGWANTTIVNLQINFSGQSISAAALTSLIMAALSTNGISLTYEVIAGFAGMIANSITNGSTISFKGQVMTNIYCNILTKERVVKTNSGVVYGPTYVNWLDSPWVYGVYPEACRFLTELY